MIVITIADENDPRLEPYRSVKDRDLVGRNGEFIAEGKVVLRELFASTRFEAQSLLVLENRLDGLRFQLEQAAEYLPVYCVSQSIMDTIVGFHMHRGILAIGRQRADWVSNSVFADDALVLVASNISNHDNVGSLFRNAASFEASAVLLDEQCCSPLYRKAIRVSVGAALKVPFRQEGQLETILNELTRQGFQIAALSPAGNAKITNLPKTGRRALLVGSEGHGLPTHILNALTTWSIPMSDSFDSLNVATASAIALFHSSRFSD